MTEKSVGFFFFFFKSGHKNRLSLWSAAKHWKFFLFKTGHSYLLYFKTHLEQQQSLLLSPISGSAACFTLRNQSPQ